MKHIVLIHINCTILSITTVLLNHPQWVNTPHLYEIFTYLHCQFHPPKKRWVSQQVGCGFSTGSFSMIDPMVFSGRASRCHFASRKCHGDEVSTRRLLLTEKSPFSGHLHFWYSESGDDFCRCKSWYVFIVFSLTWRSFSIRIMQWRSFS